MTVWVMLPLVGSLIGWFTNFIAIRMLFRPRRPLRVLWWQLQGVLPRRQAEIAQVIGETVKEDLLPVEELMAHFDLRAHGERVVEHIVAHVDERIERQLPAVIPPTMKRVLSGGVQALIRREAPALLDTLIDQTEKQLLNEIDVGAFVREKIESLDVGELEKIAVKVARTELKMVEALGAVLGFIIGLLQAVIISFSPV